MAALAYQRTARVSVPLSTGRVSAKKEKNLYNPIGGLALSIHKPITKHEVRENSSRARKIPRLWREHTNADEK